MAAVQELELHVGSAKLKARRHAANPSAGWYFIDSITRSTTWSLPSGVVTPADIVPDNVDRTDKLALAPHLDAYFLRLHPGSTLTRLATADEIATLKRRHDAQPLIQSFFVDHNLVPVGASENAPLIGPGSWTHYSLTSGTYDGYGDLPLHAGYAAERMQFAVARAVLQSDPEVDAATGWDEANDQAAWHSILLQLHAYLVAQGGGGSGEGAGSQGADGKKLLTELQQRIASAPDSIQHLPAVRTALAEVIAALENSDRRYVNLLTAILHKVQGQGQGQGGKQGLAGGEGGKGAEQDRTVDEVALARLVSAFTTHYTPALGAQLLARGGDHLHSLLHRVTTSHTWRQAVLTMLDKQSASTGPASSWQGGTEAPAMDVEGGSGVGSQEVGGGVGGEGATVRRPLDDPFLQLLARAAAGGPADSHRRAEMATASVLAGDVSFAASLASDGLTAALAVPAAPGIGTPHFGEHARRAIGNGYSSELVSLYSLDVLGAIMEGVCEEEEAVRAIVRQAEVIVGKPPVPVAANAVASAVDAAASSVQVGAPVLTPPARAEGLLASLRLARAQQEAGYALLTRPGQLTEVGLATLPADPYLLSTVASVLSAAGSPYDAGLRLRRAALQLWAADRGRAEFFPEEGAESLDASTAAAAVLAASSVAAVRPDERPADTGLAAELQSAGAAGSDLVGQELERRAQRNGAVRRISREGAAAVVRSVAELSPFFLDSSTVAQYRARWQKLRDDLAAIARCEERGDIPYPSHDPEQTHAEAQQMAAFLVGYAFTARLFSAVDVQILLLHCLFHPSVLIDPDAAALAQGAPLASDSLATALAWGISLAATPAGDKAQVSLPGEGLCDLVGPTSVGASGGGEGGMEVEVEVVQGAVGGTPPPQLQQPQLLGSASLPFPFYSTPLTQGAVAYLLPVSAGAVEPEGTPQLNEATVIQLLARTLGEAGRACKEDQAMRKAMGQAFSATATVAAIAADEVLARSEAELLLRAAAHPTVAAGLLHYCRHLILQPGVHEDAKVLKVAPIYARMAVILCERWPLLAPNALAFLRSCLQLSPPFVDAPALAPCRQAVATSLAELAITSGYALPVLSFVRDSLVKGGMEVELVRLFLSRVVERVATTTAASAPSSLSMPLALALCSLITTFQDKLRKLADASTVGATRRYEGILLHGQPGLAMAFEVLLKDVGRANGLLQRDVTQQEKLRDSEAGWTSEQRALAKYLASIEERRAAEKGVA